MLKGNVLFNVFIIYILTPTNRRRGVLPGGVEWGIIIQMITLSLVDIRWSF